MNTPAYLTEKISRHHASIEKLKKDISLEGSEFNGLDIESAIAFDAADYVWAFLSSMGCSEAIETREIRNEIAYQVENFLKSRELTFGGEAGIIIHPRRNDSNEVVEIICSTKESALASWDDSTQIATVIPEGKVPQSLNELQLDSWKSVPIDDQQWAAVEGKHCGLFDEPLYVPVPGKRTAAGVIIEEIDGRVWVTHPTNAHAGYKATFPKGELGKLDSMQAAAIREAYFKTGLKVAITGYCGDYERGQTKTRYYFARRVEGSPADMGWKAQAVSLVPLQFLSYVLHHSNDKKLVETLITERRPARRHIIKYEFGLSSGHRILTVLNGFNKKFHTWPCRLLIDSGMANALEKEILTPLGWKMLNDKLQLMQVRAGNLVAEGPDGEKFDYGRDDCDQHNSMAPNADVWLWGTAVAGG